MNTPVTKQEIIDVLNLNYETLRWRDLNEQARRTDVLMLRILRHGIAQEPNIQQLIGEIDDLRMPIDGEKLNAILTKWRTK